MSRRRTTLIASAVLALSAATGVTAAQARSGPSTPQALPAPAGHRLLADLRVRDGAQVYECLANTDGTTGGTYRARPVAVLLDSAHRHAVRGTHDSVAPQGAAFVPQWTLLDGSRVSARVQATFPAPDPTRAVAALRLDVVTNSHAGVLAGADIVQRDLVRGGVGPSGACDPATAATVSSPYRARYTFWGLS